MSAVEDYAPVVHLHRRERLQPAPVEWFLERASLTWATGKGIEVESVLPAPVAPDALGTAAAPGRPFAGADHTRPYDRRAPGSGPGVGEGFCLALARDEDRIGPAPGTSAPPVYYELDGSALTYWFFYAGSAAPMRLLPHLPPALTVEDPVALLEELSRAYPTLIEERGQPSVQMELRFDPVSAAGRALGRLSEVLRLAPDFPFMHEGDWERITIYFGLDGKPEGVAYHQHHNPTMIAWDDVPLEAGRPVVYSAEGSHASMPTPGTRIDAGDAAGPRWETWTNLVDARAQPWFGFGGAWGRIGPIADATGPLGPSPWKPPAAPVFPQSSNISLPN